jgi:ribonuclease-3 family protein
MTEQHPTADDMQAAAAAPGRMPTGPVIAPVVPRDVTIDQLSPVVLAYVGDAVFEVYVRQWLISQHARKPHQLHRAATRYVSAGAQARLLQRWMPLLTEEEAEIVRRGRNAKSGQPPRNADPLEYRLATALECLVGLLYFRGQQERLEQLMAVAFCNETIDSNLSTKDVEP